MEPFFHHFFAILDLAILLIIAQGVIIGIIVGVLPGLSATLGVALVSPLTLAMEPLTGIMLLLGIYVGAVYGGSISAILMGIPGTPAAVATVFDGNIMAKRGEGGLAIGIATISSFIGGFFSVIVLALVSKPVAILGLAFGEREYFALGVFALAAVAHFSGKSLSKGLLSAGIGIFVATIGIDEIHGIPRFTFENSNLLGGIPYMPVMIGMFAIPEILMNIESLSQIRPKLPRIERILPARSLFKNLRLPLLRSSGIGVIVGAVPGTGADIAAIVSYSQGRNLSRHPELFGTGYPEGIACPESANNAATGGTMISLLTLGIPGGAVTAIIMGAFMVHGLQPGPLLMSKQMGLVWKLIVGMGVANILMLIFGLTLARFFAKISRVPAYLLNPIILLLCFAGSFSLRNNMFDVYVMAISGIGGYVMIKTDVPRAPLIIGMILSGMVEANFARTVLLCGGDVFKFLTPISTVLIVLTILTFAIPWIKRLYRSPKKQS
jgi:putative tricarboxylic transport membrane protein